MERSLREAKEDVRNGAIAVRPAQDTASPEQEPSGATESDDLFSESALQSWKAGKPNGAAASPETPTAETIAAKQKPAPGDIPFRERLAEGEKDTAYVEPEEETEPEARDKAIERAVGLLDHGKTDLEIRAVLSGEFDNIDDANFDDPMKAAHEKFIEDVHAREDDLEKTAFEAVDKRIEVEQERDRHLIEKCLIANREAVVDLLAKKFYNGSLKKGEIAVARWESTHGRRLTGANKVFSG